MQSSGFRFRRVCFWPDEISELPWLARVGRDIASEDVARQCRGCTFLKRQHDFHAAGSGAQALSALAVEEVQPIEFQRDLDRITNLDLRLRRHASAALAAVDVEEDDDLLA